MKIAVNSDKSFFTDYIQFNVLARLLLSATIPLAGIILTEAPHVWLLSNLLIIGGSIFIFHKVRKTKFIILLYATTIAIYSLLDIAFLTSYYFQNTGFNDAFMYHTHISSIYSGFGEHIWPLLLIFACFCAIILTAFIFSRARIETSRRLNVISILALIAGVIISPPLSSLVSCIESIRASNTALADFSSFKELSYTQSINVSSTIKVNGELGYVEQVPSGTPPSNFSYKATVPNAQTTNEDKDKKNGTALAINFKKQSRKPNLVLIYAESLESQYFDEDVFPDLLPKLKQIKNNSVVFSNVQQGVGAGWTIGGIVASQCGYPLSVQHEVGGNDLSLFDKFLPKAVCLGDLLKADGYSLTFIGGADERFAGKANFLRSHGYTNLIDKNSLIKELPDKSYVNEWGAFDDTVLDAAYKKFHILSRSKKPFMFTILTMDTHHPSGFLSKSCSVYGSGDNSSLNSVHCSDKLIANFIDKIRGSKYSQNTEIIVVSDHLAMRNTATSLLTKSKQPRRLTFFINSPNGKSGNNANPGVHFDIAPTILEAVGYKLFGQMGFGSSITSGPGYLPAKFGENNWQAQAANLKAIANTLWDDDVVIDKRGINFNDQRDVWISGVKFDLSSEGLSNHIASTIFIFDDKLKLKVINSLPYQRRVAPDAFAKILLKHKDDLILAIGYTDQLSGLCDGSKSKDEKCFFFGKPYNKLAITDTIKSDLVINFDTIQAIKSGVASHETNQH